MIKRSELVSIYGEIVGGIWIDQPKWMMVATVPEFLKPFWKFNGKTVNTMYINKDMAGALYQAWENILDRSLQHHIRSYDGCHVIRPSRRDNRLSVHAYGLAIDLNAATNKLGMVPSMHLGLVECFERAGFIWGGRWKEWDGMHFQYVEEA